MLLGGGVLDLDREKDGDLRLCGRLRPPYLPSGFGRDSRGPGDREDDLDRRGEGDLEYVGERRLLPLDFDGGERDSLLYRPFFDGREGEREFESDLARQFRGNGDRERDGDWLR